MRYGSRDAERSQRTKRVKGFGKMMI